MERVLQWLRFARQHTISDIHLTEGQPPVYRQHGDLIARPEEDGTVTERDILSVTPEALRDILHNGQDIDFAIQNDAGRQRVNVYRESGRLAAAIRLLNDHIPTLESLGLPPVMAHLAAEKRGLVLITGPTGSGKSTTLAAMVQYAAHLRRCHIITIEDPIEYVYGKTPSIIHQREVGFDVPSFAAALRSSLREDPDIILLGEMRDYETISSAVTAAETGHLVFSTLHTTGAAKTVDRIIDVFPPHSQGQIRSQLASVLRGVVTQQLLPTAPDPQTGRVTGRIAATEVLLGTDAVANMIREGKGHQLGNIMQSGGAQGMMTMDACLALLTRQGRITRETAEQYAINVTELRQLMQR